MFGKKENITIAIEGTKLYELAELKKGDSFCLNSIL
jgi:hypothetical protein